MPFIRTTEATDWPEGRSRRLRIVSALLFFLPQSNPGYEGRYHLIREWLVEFDEDGLPWREVGLGADGMPVVAGPDDRNLGFWTDTNVRWGDITGEEIDRDEFERQWLKAAPLRRGEVAPANHPGRSDPGPSMKR
jgi:hypothetical protein